MLGGTCSWLEIASFMGETIMLMNLSIILFRNSHNFANYAQRFYVLFQKFCCHIGLTSSQLPPSYTATSLKYKH